MRAIAGALLIVAASVCLGAGIVGEATMSGRPGWNPSGLGYMAALVLGLFGLVLLLAGLATDSAGAQGESRPTPRWASAWTHSRPRSTRPPRCPAPKPWAA